MYVCMFVCMHPECLWMCVCMYAWCLRLHWQRILWGAAGNTNNIASQLRDSGVMTLAGLTGANPSRIITVQTDIKLTVQQACPEGLMGWTGDGLPWESSIMDAVDAQITFVREQFPILYVRVYT